MKMYVSSVRVYSTQVSYRYAIHPRSISLSSNAHHAPGALKCRMVSEGRLTPNNAASKSDYDTMPRKPHVPLGTPKKRKPLPPLPTLLYHYAQRLALACCSASECLNARSRESQRSPLAIVSSTPQRSAYHVGESRVETQLIDLFV